MPESFEAIGVTVKFGSALESAVRELGLSFDTSDPKASWTFLCGCLLHPTDDNGTHGGGPHIHSCTEHTV